MENDNPQFKFKSLTNNSEIGKPLSWNFKKDEDDELKELKYEVLRTQLERSWKQSENELKNEIKRHKEDVSKLLKEIDDLKLNSTNLCSGKLEELENNIENLNLLMEERNKQLSLSENQNSEYKQEIEKYESLKVESDNKLKLLEEKIKSMENSENVKNELKEEVLNNKNIVESINEIKEIVAIQNEETKEKVNQTIENLSIDDNKFIKDILNSDIKQYSPFRLKVLTLLLSIIKNDLLAKIEIKEDESFDFLYLRTENSTVGEKMDIGKHLYQQLLPYMQSIIFKPSSYSNGKQNKISFNCDVDIEINGKKYVEIYHPGFNFGGHGGKWTGVTKTVPDDIKITTITSLIPDTFKIIGESGSSINIEVIENLDNERSNNEFESIINGDFVKTYYINKSYAMFCLRNEHVLNESNFYGLFVEQFFNDLDYRFVSLNNMKSFYWGILASRYKAVKIKVNKISEEGSTIEKISNEIKNLDYRDYSPRSKELSDILKKMYITAGIEFEYMFKHESYENHSTSGNKVDYRSNLILSRTNKKLVENNNSFSSFDLWDVFYEEYMNDVIIDISNEFKKTANRIKFEFVNTLLNEPIYFRNKYEFWLGKAPFCNGKMGDCEKIDGGFFESVIESKHDDKDEQFGSKCWNGTKVKCKLNRNKLFGSNVGLNENNIDANKDKLEFKWIGTGPICKPSVCDLIEQRYVPISKDKHGDGKTPSCIIGSKILGVKPIDKAWEFKNWDSMVKMCQEYRVSEDKQKMELLTKIVEVGANLLKKK